MEDNFRQKNLYSVYKKTEEDSRIYHKSLLTTDKKIKYCSDGKYWAKASIKNLY